MALQLSGKEFEEIRDGFKEMDKDCDGVISLTEFKNCLMNGTQDGDDAVEFYMKVYDLNKNGSIEFPEFLEMMAFFDYNKEPLDVQITTMFEALDKDQDGLVSSRDILILWNIFIYSNEQVPFVPSLNEVKDLLLKFELDKDGKIEYSKFVAQFDFTFMESKV